MDEWDSSVWATPVVPLDNKESQSSAEKAPSASHLTASQGQTLSFSLDDAFDDKSAPATPSFFSANKFPSGSTFGGAINGSDAPADDGFGDFDDFAAPVSGQVTDDDFGEFGDFGDGGDGGGFGEVVGDGFGNDGFGTASLETPAHWQPLTVDPLPPPNELSELVQELMGPCWASLRPDDLMSDEPERQVEGLARILVTSESRSLHALLTQQSPNISNPPTWTRSRIRRQHLIALGVPVNLDEVLPQSALKPLPVLHIQTQASHHPRPLSAPPGSRHGELPPGKSGTGSARGSRTGTPVGSPIVGPGKKLPASGASRLGPKPQLDRGRIDEALAISSESLALMPLPHLEAHLATMRTLTTSTSALLSHLLQQREALQQDSETYNKLIAELVGEAQKMKSGGVKSRTGAIKRGSLM
ncbi:hypothetical protein AG1IA_00291 [Rhizoctonia solani AG-1 IA]|uniref:Uncharacterized protein n=2 Tax=Rhizoctonia solani TaxID=456999 RepID=A0A8H7HAN5_9AGAM|nr:hypothetical protein AG1IA_00291 [Rhizoctonia solani AG-1 IA]KAF8681589.1 hypothetical protein RHS04_03242 [Rhizoctonia solani]CAE6492368.1 unnamed protein product [Rhizoctonia solani]